MAASSIEICAGAGGQALGLEQAGFDHACLVELDSHACQTLRINRRNWNVIEANVLAFDASSWRGVDLFAGGVPCPPFSKAGKQLGRDDERDLFPEALRLVSECKPRAIMLENVRGLLDPLFADYREQLLAQLARLGYRGQWQLLQASQFGVSQLRPRAILVGLRAQDARHFSWPEAHPCPAKGVGPLLHGLMAANGWKGADAWSELADGIAPTLVGGSKKHGGPDLGPTRARKAWAMLGVDGRGLADTAPEANFDGMPRLTVKMASLIQGFPEDWQFSGRKTAAYRQVGNAFPPPVARAVGQSIRRAFDLSDKRKSVRASSIVAGAIAPD
jgi:DNA (cytosine-5)-methyltransferase 1